MQILPNDIVRYFAFTLQAAPLYALTTNNKQHSIVIQDTRIQRYLQKHHEKRREIGQSYINEQYMLPNESLIRTVNYYPSMDRLQSIYRFLPGETVLSETWFSDGFPETREQLIQDHREGIAYDTSRFMTFDSQTKTAMKLVLYEHGEWMASVVITDDTRAAYDLAYRKIKAIQALRE